MSSDAANESKKPRRIEVFRADEAKPLTDEHMPMLGIDDSVLAGFGKMMEAGAENAGGEVVQCLFEEPGENGLSLCYAWFKSGYLLPRHSHNADCVYYVIAGELKLGKQVLRKGDGFFVPNGAPYSYEAGPEGVEILEFRNATRFHFLFGNNDETHWQRMADSVKDNSANWAEETVPPSERPKA